MGRPAGWMKELTGRSAMKSPGKPSHRREVERWFWREIARGLSSEDAAPRSGCRRRLASGGFVSVAGWRRSCWTRSRAGICASPSARRSRCCAPRARACARSRARSAGRRRRSRASCAATRRRAAASWSTGRRWRSGRPSWWRAVPRRPSSPPTSGCASTCRTGSPARSGGPTGPRWRVRRSSRGRAATSRAARTAGGRRRGARSRSRPGCASTSPMIRRCGSRTRRSTSRCSCRAAARWPAS